MEAEKDREKKIRTRKGTLIGRERGQERGRHARTLKMAGLGKHPTSDRSSAFNPARNIRLVSPFQEKELDKYFAHFEKVADSLNWPKESWVLLLQNVLVGKAQ